MFSLLFKGYYQRPTLSVIALFQLLLSHLIILNFNKIENGVLWLVVHTIVLAILYYNGNQTFNRVKPYLSVAFILLNFTELHDLIHPIHPIDYDTMLIEWDLALFGVHPTVWMEKITFPLLTELLQWIYISFYFLPLILIFLLIKEGKPGQAEYVILQVVLCFYLSYIGYFLVPAVGPRFTLNHLQSFSLTGVWLMEPIHHLLNTLEQQQRDAFPSGHTAVTVLTAWLAMRFHKKYFAVMVPITLLMLLSTVYLRYHYVVDLFAGVALVLISVPIGKWLFKKVR